MTEPTTTAAATIPVAGGALGAMLVGFLGAVGGELAMIVIMAIVGTSAGHALAPEKPSVLRYVIALLSSIVASGFLQPLFTSLHPALIAAALGIVLIAPKQNLEALMSMIDRVRGRSAS